MPESEKLNTAVNEFSAAMKKRLQEKMEQGWRGWDDPNAILDIELINGIKNKATCPDLEYQTVDIASICMMLWKRHNPQS